MPLIAQIASLLSDGLLAKLRTYATRFQTCEAVAQISSDHITLSAVHIKCLNPETSASHRHLRYPIQYFPLNVARERLLKLALKHTGYNGTMRGYQWHSSTGLAKFEIHCSQLFDVQRQCLTASNSLS